MTLSIEQAREIVAHEFHETSGFSKDDPTLNRAKGIIEGWESALVHASSKALRHFCESRDCECYLEIRKEIRSLSPASNASTQREEEKPK